MVLNITKKLNLSTEDQKRQKNIISKLNLAKLPFEISPDRMCALNLEMARHSKKYKVFLIIFESNELGEEIYKEKISSKLPEYSYKTVAQIVDDGVKKNFFIKLDARAKTTKDLKIRNVRPSEEVIIEFINWKIDLLASLMKFKKDLIN